VLRLGVATLAGGLIGLNRDLRGKPIGLKTPV
jgi:putative Mg2+ transporter-C (MgtC) family protein